MEDMQPTKDLRFAIVGAPNCGKTALFNALTGSRQKVGNYSGVTVERKSGVARTPAGTLLDIVDLPGTYSLRARSPDEEVTRDLVLGKRAGEPAPDLLIVVVDATSVRSGLRLVMELRKVGRPLLLVLNMIDIARHRGIDIDVAALSSMLQIPVVTATAVRRGGLDELWKTLDDIIAAGIAPAQENRWAPPSAADLRQGHREADVLIAAAVREPTKPDTLTNRIDAVLLHPVAGLLILLTLLFVMFQAVFSWAQPAMSLLSAGFAWLGALSH